MMGGMAKRKRKHGRPGGGAQRPRSNPGRTTADDVPRDATPAPSGSGARPPAPDGKAAMARGYAKAEERNEKIRAELDPIAPGERPKVVVAAAAWMGLLALGLIVAAVFGNNLRTPVRIQEVVLATLSIVAAVGTYRLTYWAILGTQTFLGLNIAVGLLALLFLPWYFILLVSLQTAISGYLFWKLIRVMARVQKTQRMSRNDR